MEMLEGFGRDFVRCFESGGIVREWSSGIGMTTGTLRGGGGMS